MPIRSAHWAIACLALASAQCTGADGEACPLGDERPCQGADNCSGSQRCTAVPATWSDCDCSLGDPAPAPALGEACDTDEDCPEGATCLREDRNDLFGGGPPRGMCVVDCSESTEKCERFGDAVCVNASEDPNASRAFCFPGCAPGLAQLDKCGERTDLACEPLSTGADAGFCRPFCTRDEECRNGGCDRRRGAPLARRAAKTSDSHARPQGTASQCTRVPPTPRRSGHTRRRRPRDRVPRPE
jgi:hypothetical protein